MYYSAKSLTGPAETQNASRRLLGGWVMDSNGQSEPRLCKSGDRSANGAAWVICPEAFHREIEPSDRQIQAGGIGGLPTFSVITSNIYETGEDLCCLLFVVFKRACQSVSGPPPPCFVCDPRIYLCTNTTTRNATLCQRPVQHPIAESRSESLCRARSSKMQSRGPLPLEESRAGSS